MTTNTTPARTAVLHLTAENFEETVKDADLPVLVDFWAEWCGPCRMMAPVLDEFAREHSGTAVVAKLNVDEYPELASRFGVRALPTILAFRNGEVTGNAVGLIQKERLAGLLES